MIHRETGIHVPCVVTSCSVTGYSPFGPCGRSIAVSTSGIYFKTIFVY